MSRTELIRVTADPKPSIWSKLAEVVRSYTVGPLTSRSPELAKYFGGGGPSMAGVTVTEHNISSVSAVWAAVGLIADDVASLPLMLYKRLPNGGKDKFESHPLYRLLHDEPNPEMTSMVFRRTMQAHVSIWQNAYAEIERDKVGRPIALWPLVPESVRVARDRTRALVYVVSNPDGGESTIPASDMIHLVGRSHDGTVGSSLVEKAKESIGLALAAEQFGATFFGNGATFGGVISFKGAKPPEMSDENYRQQLEARHQGVKRAHKLLALYNDASYTETGVEPNNAQFLETRTFQIREVARWFKIPPHKLADLADATFSNVEQMNTEYYTSAIRPWLVLWEQELTRKLVARLERSQQFIEHSIEGFLRGDTAARSAFYTSLFNIGAITINEVRGYENLDPLPGGDQAFVQVNNLMPLDKVNEHAQAQIDAMKAKPEPRVVAAPQPAPEEMKALLADVETRMAEHVARLSAEVARSTAAEVALAERAQQVDALGQDLEHLRAAIAERDRAAAELDRQHRADLASQVERTAEQIATLERDWIAERDRLQQARDAAQAAKNDLDVMLGVAEKERDNAASEAAAALVREADVVNILVKRTAEVDDLQARNDTAAAVAEELRRELAEQRQMAERLAQARAEAEAKCVAAQNQAGDYQLMANEQEQRAIAVETTARAAVDRLGAMAVAHRALFVDAIARLLQREGDRARKAQTSPEKLRAWVESFYQLHGDTCRSALRPVVLAWAPCVGMNAEAVLAELVQDHLDTSRRDLRLAADTEDADELAANLARVLHRWETERADAVADRLLAEGERHGH